MVLSGSRTSGRVSKNRSSSRSRGASNTRKVSSSARARAQRISSLRSSSSSSSRFSSSSSSHSSYNPQTGFGHTPTGFRSYSHSSPSRSLSASSRPSVLTMVINGRRLDPTKPADQRIIAQVQHQRKIRQINAQQQKLAARMRNARNAQEAMKIREQAMAENPELGTHNQVSRDGRIVRTSGQLGVSAPKPVTPSAPKKRTEPPKHLGISQEEAHSVIKSFENNVAPKKAQVKSFENNSVPNNAKPVEQHPLGEFAKGLTSGFNDLWIVGNNIASQVQGKEPTQEPKGNALSDAIFAPVDAGLNSSSFEEFAHNLGDRANTIGNKFNENPARELGKMFPDLLITAASVVAPPVGAARWGGQAAKVASKAATKSNPQQKIRPPGLSKRYPKSDESKLVRNNNSIDASDGIPIPSKPTELYGKEFVKTAQRQNKKNLVAKNTKISDDILKHGSNARTNQPHPNSRAGLNNARTNQQTVQKTKPTRQNTRPKLTQKQKDLAKEIRERFASQNVRNSKAVSKIVKTKPKGKTRVGTKTRAGLVGAGLVGLAAARNQKKKVKPIPFIENPLVEEPKQTPDQKTEQTPGKDNPKDDPTTTPPTFGFDEDVIQNTVTKLPPAITPPSTPFWRGFPYGGGSGGVGNPSGRGQKSYTAWAVKGVFEPVKLGLSVDSLTDIENYHDVVKPKRTTRKSARKTRTRKTSNPFGNFWN